MAILETHEDPTLVTQLGPTRQLVTPEYIEPTFGETLSAAFAVENSLGSALSDSGAQAPVDVPLPNLQYDPFEGDELDGYEQFARAFIMSHSPEETAAIKLGIDREIEDRRILDSAGAGGVVAQVAAGVMDPLFLPLLLLPGGQALKFGKPLTAAAEFGGTAAVAETVAELAKHTSQDVRTTQESLFNIGGATLMTGVMGGALGLLTRGERDAIAKSLHEELPDGLGPDSVGAAARNPTTFEQQTPSPTGVGLEANPISPLTRLSNSPSLKVRQFFNEMVENPMFFRGNDEGVALSGETGAVESAIKQYDAALGQSLEEMDKLYLQYRQAGSKLGLVATPRAGKLTARQFREEIGKALRRGDNHEIAEVAQAAKAFRSRVFDPAKKAAIDLKLLPEDVKVKTAPSYLTRVWKTELIHARRPEFVNVLSRWIVREGGDGDEAEDVAEQIVDNILGHPGARVPLELMPSRPVAKAGPLKERVLLIPDEEIEEFLESDIDVIARYYTRTMAPEIELVARFGDKDMKGAFQQIADDYTQIRGRVEKDTIDAAKREKELADLGAKQDRDMRDLLAVRDRLLGKNAAPDDPNSPFIRGVRVVKNLNFLRLLGGMTLSAIPDMARPVMTHGLRPWMKSLRALALSPKMLKLSARETKLAGTAWDMVLNTRANSLAEIMDRYGRNSAFERGLDSFADQFSKLTLMAPWNAAMKQFAGTVTGHEIMRISGAWAAGSASPGDIRKLANLGVGERMASRIAREVKEHGYTEDGVTLANFHLWTDRDAARAYRSAVVKDVDRAIVTPGVADRPVMMDSALVSLLLQFKSFALSATNRMLITGLQQRDMAAMNGLVLAMALGTVAYSTKQLSAGKEVSDDPRVWVKEAIDRSGALGILMEVNNIAEKATRGRAGLSAIVGGEPLSRYASRNVAGALFGPTADAAADFSQSLGALSTQDFKRSDIRAIRKMLPMQNLFYIRQLLNSVEEGAANAVGAQ